MLLSILIPAYNYNPAPLIEDLSRQDGYDGWEIEILVGDDGSKPLLHITAGLPGRIIRTDVNLGRAGLRNLLANNANGNYYLFIDVDSRIPDNRYLIKYIKLANQASVLAGGTCYKEKHNPAEFNKLRWRYGKAREERSARVRSQKPYSGLALNNLFISRAAWQKVGGLNEDLKGYGHEDTLLGEALKELNIPIKHIDNPVAHVGLESDEVFIAKCKEAARVLAQLVMQGEIKPEATTLSKMGERIKALGLAGLISSLKPWQLPFLPQLTRLQLVKLVTYLQARIGK